MIIRVCKFEKRIINGDKKVVFLGEWITVFEIHFNCIYKNTKIVWNLNVSEQFFLF